MKILNLRIQNNLIISFKESYTQLNTFLALGAAEIAPHFKLLPAWYK